MRDFILFQNFSFKTDYLVCLVVIRIPSKAWLFYIKNASTFAMFFEFLMICVEYFFNT